MFVIYEVKYLEKFVTYDTINTDEHMQLMIFGGCAMNISVLDRRRRQLGMSLLALARLSGVSPSTLRRAFVEGGNMTFANLKAVADVLEMDIRFVERRRESVMLRSSARQGERACRPSSGNIVPGRTGGGGRSVSIDGRADGP